MTTSNAKTTKEIIIMAQDVVKNLKLFTQEDRQRFMDKKWVPLPEEKEPVLKTRDTVNTVKKQLAKMAKKAIVKDGVPTNQLNEQDMANWDGVNIQGYATSKPEPDEDALALYMVDCDRKLVKRFTVTSAMLALACKNTAQITYGTTDAEGRQIKTIIKWENERRVPAGLSGRQMGEQAIREMLEGENRIRQRKDIPDTRE